MLRTLLVVVVLMTRSTNRTIPLTMTFRHLFTHKWFVMAYPNVSSVVPPALLTTAQCLDGLSLIAIHAVDGLVTTQRWPVKELVHSSAMRLCAGSD